MIVSHFSYFIILLLGGGDVIETLGGHKTPVLKVVLCTCFTDPRFIAFIHFGPIYMFVRFAVHLYICYFVKVSNHSNQNHRLPDNSPAVCDPDGENPCCRHGECGNTADYCTCSDCVDYSVIYRDWRESGGKRKWRYDGKCGSEYPLPDKSPAECDPDGENPCCSGNGWCSNTTWDCSCSDCVDYSIVSEVRKSGENCTVTAVSGFLKNACFDETKKRHYFKCAHSDVYFKRNTYKGSYQLH